MKTFAMLIFENSQIEQVRLSEQIDALDIEAVLKHLSARYTQESFQNYTQTLISPSLAIFDFDIDEFHYRGIVSYLEVERLVVSGEPRTDTQGVA